MPFAYYSRAATTQFWSEHWGGHSVEELLRVAQTSPLTSLLEQHLPRQGSILEAGCGLGQYVLLLRKRGYRVEQQKQFPVYYEAELVGTLVPDMIVNEAVIVDPKVVTAFHDTHLPQMIGYLSITNLKLALLINFKNAKLEWKRVVR